MAAYAIFIREGEVVDAEAMAQYQSGNSAVPDGVEMKPLVVYGEMEWLEGEPADGIVILQFGDRQQAHDWYYGAYLERAKIRQKAAPYRAVIVDGF
jgi:uncharacterized protein (DUF1330 family)